MSNSPFQSSVSLRHGAKTCPVSNIAAEVVPHVQGMTAVMVEHKLLGLAGPQVGIDCAFFLVAEDGKIRVVINPTFDSPSFTKSKRNECGLDPGHSVEIPRPLFVWCRYQDEEGARYNMQLMRGRARVWLHLGEYLAGTSIFRQDAVPLAPKVEAL